MQLIYQGKSDRCHPREIEFPDGFNITHTPNHWSNENKVIDHFESIIFPFVKKKKEELVLPSDQKALLIFDVSKNKKGHWPDWRKRLLNILYQQI